MSTLPLEQVEAVVHSKPTGVFYIAEKLTPLSFTPIYRELTPEQRFRYNQISGLYFLEQTIFFEQCMGGPVLAWLQRNAPEPLRAHAAEFEIEENRHTSWFRALLREVEPEWYEDDTLRFVRPSGVASASLNFCNQRPHLFPCLLWLQLIAEERAQYFSGTFLAAAEELDPRFLEVQRKHLADEGGHIRWDVAFIEWLWPAVPRLVRIANARILQFAMREFFYLPKRSGWNVIERLMVEFPELESRRGDLRAAMDSLGTNDAYLRTLYPRCVFPKTRNLASRWPELRFLGTFFT
ncbi:MAG: diiron oxygenase [Chthoniobacteraceae bacterium]